LELIFLTRNFLIDVFSCSWEDAAAFSNLVWLINLSFYCICLSWTSLPICKYRNILPIQCLLYKWFNFIKKLLLVGLRFKNLVKIVTKLLALFSFDLYWLCCNLFLIIKQRKLHSITLFFRIFDPTEHSHVSFQLKYLLLLNYSDLFMLVQTLLHLLNLLLMLLNKFILLFILRNHF
jgi:hypothetical protein